MDATNRVEVFAAVVDDIIKLSVSRPRQTNRALSLVGQTELEHFHVTLARLDDLGIAIQGDAQLPMPPASLRLDDKVYAVRDGEKVSCYVLLCAADQGQLRDYVRKCEERLGYSGLLDVDRLFHVTVSNSGGGGVRASVGSVWKHPSWLV